MSDSNLTFLGDMADWYDLQLEESDKFLVEQLAQTRGFGPEGVSLKAFVGYVAVTTVAKFAQGFVDVLRLGNSLRERTFKAVGQDALRLLNVVPLPIGKVTSLTRILEIKQESGTMTCAFVTTVNALRRTGQRFFVGGDELAKAIGTTWEAIVKSGTNAEQIGQIVSALKKMGVSVEEITASSSTFTDFEALVRSKPPGAVLFPLRFVSKGVVGFHRIYATLSRGSVIYQDTDGVVFKSLAELFKVYKEGQVSTHAPLIYMRNATLIESSILLAPFTSVANVYFPVLPVPVNPTNERGQIGPPQTATAH